MAALFEKGTRTMNVQFQPGRPNSGTASPVRMCRTGVARWRCARGLPGRSLRGARRGQHQSRLGRRRLNRRHQLSHHCGKRTGRAGREAARLLAGDHRQPAGRLGCHRRRPHSERPPAARALQPVERDLRARQRAPRAFSRFGSPLPGCIRTARSRPRAFTRPSS